MTELDLTRDELVLIAKHRRCEIGGIITICGQKFRMCMSSSNSIYMHNITPQPQTELALAD